jgi:hypothetical protein
MDSGKYSKKSRQREQLILALLQQPTLAKAAASMGISTTTAWRISKTPAFQEEYREARRDRYSQAIARLQQASSIAASTILKLLVDPRTTDSNRLRAAQSILEQSAKGIVNEELAARILHMEQLVNTEIGHLKA